MPDASEHQRRYAPKAGDGSKMCSYCGRADGQIRMITDKQGNVRTICPQCKSDLEAFYKM